MRRTATGQFERLIERVEDVVARTIKPDADGRISRAVNRARLNRVTRVQRVEILITGKDRDHSRRIRGTFDLRAKLKTGRLPNETLTALILRLLRARDFRTQYALALVARAMRATVRERAPLADVLITVRLIRF